MTEQENKLDIGRVDENLPDMYLSDKQTFTLIKDLFEMIKDNNKLINLLDKRIKLLEKK